MELRLITLRFTIANWLYDEYSQAVDAKACNVRCWLQGTLCELRYIWLYDILTFVCTTYMGYNIAWLAYMISVNQLGTVCSRHKILESARCYIISCFLCDGVVNVEWRVRTKHYCWFLYYMATFVWSKKSLNVTIFRAAQCVRTIFILTLVYGRIVSCFLLNNVINFEFLLPAFIRISASIIFDLFLSKIIFN